jgi:hypothetical protein
MAAQHPNQPSRCEPPLKQFAVDELHQPLDLAVDSGLRLFSRFGRQP